MTPFIQVLRYATIDSTNLEAARLVATGQSESVWLLADEQTAGRGRANRNWHSAQGGLYSTLLYVDDIDQTFASQLSLVMALAVYETLSEFIPSQKLSLKWPNDCLVDGAKISGILAEACGTGPLQIAIGCGINVNSAPGDMPYPVTCVCSHAPQATVATAFTGLMKHTSQWLNVWQRGKGFDVVRETWVSRADPLGSTLKVSTGSGDMCGQFIGLAPDGALLLKVEAGQTRRVYAGDVSVIR